MQERYQICIAQDKTRARRWANHRILKREPLVVAEDVVTKYTSQNIAQVSQSSPKMLLHDMRQREKKMNEVSKI